MTSEQPKPRLWVLPVGLFPRRVTIYLEEKGIAEKFEIVPVNITESGMEQAEGKPPSTLPILEIKRATENESGEFIFQSTAILEYLEDVYGSEGQDMRGPTPAKRARVRECMDMVNELTTWTVLYVQNASSLYGALREQRKEAAAEGLERAHKALNVLENLADSEGPFLVGKTPTTADCALVALIQFSRQIYHVDWTAQHRRFGKVVDAFDARGTARFPELPLVLQNVTMTLT